MPQKRAVPVVIDSRHGIPGCQPGDAVVRLDRVTQAQCRTRHEDMTHLFCPEVVFRHIGKAPKRPQSARRRDTPSRFFDHFAIQCLQGAFARVDTAAGQLKLRLRRALESQQNGRSSRQNRVGAGAQRIAPFGVGRCANPSDRVPPFQFLRAILYRRDMPMTGTKGNPNDTRFATRVGRYRPAIPT